MVDALAVEAETTRGGGGTNRGGGGTNWVDTRVDAGGDTIGGVGGDRLETSGGDTDLLETRVDLVCDLTDGVAGGTEKKRGRSPASGRPSSGAYPTIGTLFYQQVSSILV